MTSKTLAGPALPVTLLAAPLATQAGAAMPVQVVGAAYVTQHGLQAGDPLPVYTVTTGKVQAGAVVPVYVAG